MFLAVRAHVPTVWVRLYNYNTGAGPGYLEGWRRVFVPMLFVHSRMIRPRTDSPLLLLKHPRVLTSACP